MIVNKYFLIFWLVIDYFPFSIYYWRTKETRGVKIDSLPSQGQALIIVGLNLGVCC